MTDIDRAKQALPLPNLIEKLTGSPLPSTQMRGGSLTIPSPLRDDGKTASFQITQKEDGWLWYDHGGEKVGGDEISLIEHYFSLTKRESVLRFLTLAGIQPEKRSGEKITTKKIVSTYDYTDKDGKLLYQVVRFEPKDFRQRQPSGDGWQWNLKGAARTIYRLPEILRAPSVVIVEGEKDADKLWELGIPATTCAMGAGKWTKDFSELLRGKRVTVFPDADSAGKKHGSTVTASLHSRADSVYLVDLAKMWPQCPKGGDVSDALESGISPAKIKEWINEATQIETFDSDLEEALANLKHPDPKRRIWYDGKGYGVNLRGHWFVLSQEDLTRRLLVRYGLSSARNGGTFSETDVFLHTVQEECRVSGMGSNVGYPPGMVLVDGNPTLNIWTNSSIDPATTEEEREWGDGFPWVASYLDALTAGKDHLEKKGKLLAWIQRHYRALRESSGEDGQALVLVGPTECGKSFLGFLLGEMMGGQVDGTKFFLGEENFSAALLDVPVVTLDDPPPPRDRLAFRKVQGQLKSWVANRSFYYRDLQKKGCKVRWNGRLVLTINDNPEAATAIPEIRSDVSDKYLMIDVGRFSGFKSASENEEILRKELPAFCDWLLSADFSPLLTNRRYGLEGWQSQRVQEIANGSSFNSYFAENVQHFLDSTLAEDETWEGTGKMLIEDIRKFQPIYARGLRSSEVVTTLISLGIEGYEIEDHGNQSKYIASIKAPRRNVITIKRTNQ